MDVRPELDVAVLKIILPEGTSSSSSSLLLPTPLSFGASSNLLVGQGLIAIGNPFGLDNSVTTGVVSALNRELQQTRRNRPGMNLMMPPPTPLQPIRNCIQTDCAINPGNSGGPLLNRQGAVVGVNTAILTTSGSNAGVGFAIEADQVAPVVQDMIRRDVARQSSSQQQRVPWLGVSIVRTEGVDVAAVAARGTVLTGCRVARVEQNSPAAEAGIRGITLRKHDASVQWGDTLVAVGGNTVDSLAALQSELDTRAVGEQIQITLQDESNNMNNTKRVVYLTLRARPTASAMNWEG